MIRNEKQRSIVELVKLRNNLRAEVSAETAANDEITENLLNIRRQRYKQREEIEILFERIDELTKCQLYSGCHEFRLITEMKRKKKVVNEFRRIQGTLFNPSPKTAQLAKFNREFSKQLEQAPWLPEKMAILDELKEQQHQLEKVQKEIAKADEMINERMTLLHKHKEIPFKSLCLALANYSSRARSFLKTKDNEILITAQLEQAMSKLMAAEENTAEKQTPKHIAATEENITEKQTPKQIRATEENIAEKQPPKHVRAAEENIAEKQPPKHVRAAEENIAEKQPPKHVRFEIMADEHTFQPPKKIIKCGKETPKKYPPNPPSFGCNDFLFGSAGKKKQREEVVEKPFTTSFLDMDHGDSEINISKDGGIFGNLFGAGRGESVKEQSFMAFNFDSTIDNAGSSSKNDGFPFQF